MTIDEEPECEPVSGTDKADAIRKRYCLENSKVFEGKNDDYTFYEYKNKFGEEYLCFEADDLDTILYNGKVYFIKRFK